MLSQIMSNCYSLPGQAVLDGRRCGVETDLPHIKGVPSYFKHLDVIKHMKPFPAA